MLSISTVEEALTYLSEKTGHTWTKSQLFDIVSKLNISLRAVVPLDVLSARWHYEQVGPSAKPRWAPSHPMLAMVYPCEVASIWQLGEAMLYHAEDRSLPKDEMNLLVTPIRVTVSEVRIRDEALRAILAAWTDAQSGSYWWRVPGWAQIPRGGQFNSDEAKIEPFEAAQVEPKTSTEVAPWLRSDPRDDELEPFHLWGAAARYFARLHVQRDPALLTKRDALALQVHGSLEAAKIRKRGGVRSPDPLTIKKAFSGLDFS